MTSYRRWEIGDTEGGPHHRQPVPDCTTYSVGLWGIERSSEDIVQEQFWSYPGSGSAAACRRGHVAGIHWANFLGSQDALEKARSSLQQPPTFGSRGMTEVTSGK